MTKLDALELGQKVHEALETIVSSHKFKGWTYPLPSESARLRSAGIKPLKKRINGSVHVLFPSWAVELLQHPECSKRMLTGTKRNLDYRAEKLMEVRWEKRG